MCYPAWWSLHWNGRNRGAADDRCAFRSRLTSLGHRVGLQQRGRAYRRIDRYGSHRRGDGSNRGRPRARVPWRSVGWLRACRLSERRCFASVEAGHTLARRVRLGDRISSESCTTRGSRTACGGGRWNCEHFCKWSVRGEPRSLQVEAWLRRPARMVLTTIRLVWAAPMPRPSRAPNPVGSPSCR